MRGRIAAVVEELQRLKRSGVTSVHVSAEALALLRAAVGEAPVAEAAPHAVRGVSGVVREVAPVRTDISTLNRLMVDLEKPVIIATPQRGATAAPTTNATDPNAIPPPPALTLPGGTKRERWEWLRTRVLECPVCRAHTHGNNKVVFGVGSIDADIFFCGEAPGAEEEIQGEPFVGPAGQLLSKMIQGMGLKRESVYIGNILNWRPEMEGRVSKTSITQTGNRPPTPAEIKFGLAYLRAQVEVVQPKVIVALGSTAAEGLLGAGSFSSLGSIRGRWLQFQNTPLMVTYHPSYLLRNDTKRTKRMVWEDLLQVMEKVALPISEKQRGFFL